MPGGGAARFAQGLRGAPVAGLSLGLDAREALEVRGGGERGEPLACLGQQAGEGARLAAELARGRMQRAQARVEFGQAPGVEFGAVQVAGEFTRGVAAEWTKSGSGTTSRFACASETIRTMSWYAPVPRK